MIKQYFLAILFFLVFSKTYSQDTINKKYRVGIDVSYRISDKYFDIEQLYSKRYPLTTRR